MRHGGPLSPNFQLYEFLPAGWDGSVPPDVLAHLTALCETLLEPARAYVGVPIRISSGWRPPEQNAGVGGVAGSDHLTGRAADIWANGVKGEPWQLTTMRIFKWASGHLRGKYGQLILEDHRASTGRDTAIWVHISIPSPKHPGIGDPNATLISPAKGEYFAYEGHGA